MTNQTKRRSGSRRERERDLMIEAALARPGVRDLMDVYRGWQEQDRRLDTFRSATKSAVRVTTSNSSQAPWPSV